MPLYLTAAHSSRVQKPARTSIGRRHSSSPFAAAARTKSIQRTKPLADASFDEADHDDHPGGDRLDPTGKVLSGISVAAVQDVTTAVQYSTRSMFCAIPERAGMNSTRIAEVLNFQRNLPRVVSLAHVHALVSASSKTERQIAALQAAGQLRKIKVTGRGNDISGTSEVLITTDDVHALLQRSPVAPDVVSAFMEVLRQHPRAVSFSSQLLSVSELTALTRAGFLVSSSLSGTRHLALSGSSLVAMPRVSRAASGTSGAVGGDAAFENLGGVGAARRPNSESPGLAKGGELVLSIPNIGPYLRLLNAARAHLLALLSKSKYSESPLDLLRERWDGAVDSEGRVSVAKRIRGDFSGVLPGKTKKWKDLYGLSFDWVLEECVGAGLMELFETRSVGLGVRALT